MFKKVLILATILTFIKITSVQAVSNFTNNPSNKRSLIEERILARENKLMQLSEIRQQRQASIAAKLSDLRKNIIRKFYSNMSQRILAMIDRLEKLTLRIDSRIAKIEAGGTTVDQSTKEEITKAKQLLLDSRALLNSSNSMLEGTLSSNLPKDAFKIMKDNINDIKINLIEVHRILVDVIRNIKGLRVGNKEGLTPTIVPTVTPTITPTPTPSI
jgi:hypothetical protein